MDNPLKKMIGDYSSLKGEAKSAGEGLAAKGEMMQKAQEALGKSSPASAPKPAAPSRPASWEKTGKAAPAGEKEMYQKASEWAKPMSYKDGGEVHKTGVAMVHKGEHVLTPEHKAHIKNALSMAEGALSHDPEAPPAEPKKEVKEMHIRKGASGGHIVRHIHVHAYLHPDEEHVTTGTDHLMNHVMEHMTDPDEGEEEAEAGDHGIDAIEHAVGYK